MQGSVATIEARLELEASYKLYQKEHCADLREQSRQNLSALRQRVTSLYEEATLERLKQEWMTKVAPQFALKHVTRDLRTIEQTGAVLSLHRRTREDDKKVLNRHTGKQGASQHQVYCTLGLTGHKQITYWLDKTEMVVADVGKAASDDAEFKSLWISTHHTPILMGQVEPSNYFGSTRRTVFFQDNLQHIRYDYTDDKESITRPLDCKENVFCAEDGLDSLFEALFLQTMEEAHYIGGEYQQQLLAANSSIGLLQALYSNLFTPDVYPEAKLMSGKLSIAHPNVHTVSNLANQPELFLALFNAIEKADAIEMEKLLANEFDINAIHSETTLLIYALEQLKYKITSSAPSYKALTPKLKRIIELLFNKGADITASNGKAFTIIVTARNDVLYEYTQLAIAGIPDLQQPLIHHCPSFLWMTNVPESSAHSLALRTGNWMSFVALMDANIQPPPDWAVFVDAFLGGCDSDEQIDYLLMHFPDALNLTSDRVKLLQQHEYGTVLMVAARENARGKQYLIEQKIEGEDPGLILIKKLIAKKLALNFNVCNTVGNTALMIAIQEANYAVAALLIQYTDINIRNDNGETAYSLTNRLLAIQEQISEDDRNAEIRKKIDVYKQVQRLLEQKDEKLIKAPSPITQEEYAVEREYAAAVMVIRQQQGQAKQVLMVRKQSPHGEAFGNYMFPGGLRDHDEDYMTTAARECLEETGIAVKCDEIFVYKKLVMNHYKRLHFGRAVLEDTAQLDDDLVAGSDVIEAIWVDIESIETREVHGESVSYYNGVAIEPSNMTLLKTEIDATQINKKKLQKQMRTAQAAKYKLNYHYNKGSLEGFKACFSAHCMSPFVLETFLLSIIKDDKTDWLDLLIELGLDTNAKISIPLTGEFTLLQRLIKDNKFIMAKKLIDAGADVNFALAHNDAPLTAVAEVFAFYSFYNRFDNENIHLKIKDFLLWLLENHKIELSADAGGKALTYLVFAGDIKLVQLLLKLDTNHVINFNQAYRVNIPMDISSGHRYNPMIAALAEQNLEIMALLAKNGAKLIVTPDMELDPTMKLNQAGYRLIDGISSNFAFRAPLRSDFLRSTSDPFIAMQKKAIPDIDEVIAEAVNLSLVQQFCHQHSTARHQASNVSLENKLAIVRDTTTKNKNKKRVLLVRPTDPAGNGYGHFQLPKHINHYCDDIQAPIAEVYRYSLPGVFSSNVIVNAYDISKPSILEDMIANMEQADNQPLECLWVDWDDVNKQHPEDLSGDSRFTYHSHSICLADALLIEHSLQQEIAASAEPNEEAKDATEPVIKSVREIDIALFIKRHGGKLLYWLWLTNNKKKLAELVQQGANLNELGAMDLVWPSVFHFDWLYNDGRWSEFLLELGLNPLAIPVEFEYLTEHERAQHDPMQKLLRRLEEPSSGAEASTEAATRLKVQLKEYKQQRQATVNDKQP